MQWDDSPNAGFTTGEPFAPVIEGELGYQRVNVARQLPDKTSLLNAIRHMIAVRQEHAVFGRGSMEWVLADPPSVAAYWREDHYEALLILNNLSESSQTVTLPAEHQGTYVDLLTDAEHEVAPTLTLQPYAFLWLKQHGH
jgi:glycosidase